MTVLVAANGPGIRFIQNLFGDVFSVKPASHLQEALRILNGGVDVVLCSLQFDESRMFDLLVAAKSSPRGRAARFVCFRQLPSILEASMLRTLEVTCRAEGSVFIDLADLRRRYGKRAAEERFRRAVLSPIETAGAPVPLYCLAKGAA
jgi:hypothetical protein